MAVRTKKKKTPARECWCPCNCGCTEPEERMVAGLCRDCARGNHEIPPEGVYPGVEHLLPLHNSIVRKYRELLRLRHDANVEMRRHTEKQP